VLPTIQFHGKPCFAAIEIENVTIKRMLSAETKTVKLFPPQTIPK